VNSAKTPSVVTKPLIFIGISAVVFPLYVYHNPVRWDALAHNFTCFFLVLRPYTFYGHVGDLLLLLGLWAVGYGLGTGVIRRCLRSRGIIPPVELAVPIGWGILSFLIFSLALIRQLYPIAIALLLLGLLGIGLWSLQNDFKEIGRRIRQKREAIRRFHLEEWIGLLLIALSMYYAFCSSLMPPTQSDGLRYHLAAPKLYLRHGGFYVIPDLAFSNFPFLVEYLYAIPLALGSLSGPKLIHCSYFFLTLALIYRLGKTLGGVRAGLFAAAIPATTPFIPIFASWSFIEFGLTCYTVLGFRLCLEIVEPAPSGEETSRRGWEILLGIAGGFMVSCKYTALITVAFLWLVVAWPRSFQLSAIRSTMMRAARVGLISLLIASPWFLKNAVLFGNPVYPFGRAWFPTPGWSEFNAVFFSYHAGLKGNLNAIKQSPMGEQWLDFLTLPARVTLYPGEAWHRENFGSWPLGVLWLSLAPILLMRRSWSNRYLWHLLFSLLLFFVWAYTYRDSRFLLPCLSIAAPLYGLAVTELIAQRRNLGGWLLVMALYGVSWSSGLLLLPRNYMPWEVISGTISRQFYLENVTDFVRYENQAFRFLKENTKREDRVLLHGIEQPFYCPNDWVGADWFNTDPLIRWSWENPSVEGLIKRLKDEKIQYIVYYYGKIKDKEKGYNFFYRLFRLPPDQGLMLLKELVSKERTRLRYPYLYQEWRVSFMERLIQAETQAANVTALTQLWDAGVLKEVYRYKENPSKSDEGILVLKVPD